MASTESDSTATATATEEEIAVGQAAIAKIHAALVNSWMTQLHPETELNLAKSRALERLPETDDNRSRRPVYNGHYVTVKPTGLAQPRLVLYSKDLAAQLQLTGTEMESPAVVDWLSGNQGVRDDDDDTAMSTWATPYALSIMGQRYTSNCPYGTGHGYGDGRAISIGELHGLELQLKGAGRTPFCRGADGRAVLRSSLREFLASEAMHYLGIATTRALSLVVSETETVARPWYSAGARLQIPTLDDARLADLEPAQAKQVIAQLRNQKADPNIMVQEKAAMTCRVAPSFLRIGHIDLFARRAIQASKRDDASTTGMDTTTPEYKELEALLWHACFRECKETAYDPYFKDDDLASAVTVLLHESAQGIADMVAGWLRVGFAQGNFNADNCLVGGRTMDYGPFGFMEEYHPLFAKWTGSGEHFGFLNQPSAAYANYHVLVTSVAPLLATLQTRNADEIEEEFMQRANDLFQLGVDETFRVKLGFGKDQDAGDDVWAELEPLLRSTRTDWTVFFRQLTYAVRHVGLTASPDHAEKVLAQLENADSPDQGAFYECLTPEQKTKWLAWIETWRQALQEAVQDDNGVYERMRTANPKYILREWMLVEAYQNADERKEAELFNLYLLIQRPYDEGSDFESTKYYRRAPEEALTTGGVAFMS